MISCDDPKQGAGEELQHSNKKVHITYDYRSE